MDIFYLIYIDIGDNRWDWFYNVAWVNLAIRSGPKVGDIWQKYIWYFKMKVTEGWEPGSLNPQATVASAVLS